MSEDKNNNTLIEGISGAYVEVNTHVTEGWEKLAAGTHDLPFAEEGGDDFWKNLVKAADKAAAKTK